MSAASPEPIRARGIGRGDVRLKDGWAALSPIPGSFKMLRGFFADLPRGLAEAREGEKLVAGVEDPRGASAGADKAGFLHKIDNVVVV